MPFILCLDVIELKLLCRGLSGSFLAMRILVQMKIGKVLFYAHDICEFEEIENDPDTA